MDFQNLESHKLAKIRYLSLNHNNISSLKGIKVLKELQSLAINFNKITNLTDFIPFLPEGIRHVSFIGNPVESEIGIIEILKN